jgi:hypothetical protein
MLAGCPAAPELALPPLLLPLLALGAPPVATAPLAPPPTEFCCAAGPAASNPHPKPSTASKETRIEHWRI